MAYISLEVNGIKGTQNLYRCGNFTFEHKYSRESLFYAKFYQFFINLLILKALVNRKFYICSVNYNSNSLVFPYCIYFLLTTITTTLQPTNIITYSFGRNYFNGDCYVIYT